MSNYFIFISTKCGVSYFAYRTQCHFGDNVISISRTIDNTGPVPLRGALSQLYPANSTASLYAPDHAYNFSHCGVTLNITGNDAVQKSTSDLRRGYKRIFIEESDTM